MEKITTKSALNEWRPFLLKEREHMKHYITKYRENGKRYAESWMQIDLFGRSYCFSKKKIEI